MTRKFAKIPIMDNLLCSVTRAVCSVSYTGYYKRYVSIGYVVFCPRQ